jgi:hypothetical protein
VIVAAFIVRPVEEGFAPVEAACDNATATAPPVVLSIERRDIFESIGPPG